jgi:hypothetical protein
VTLTKIPDDFDRGVTVKNVDLSTAHFIIANAQGFSGAIKQL